jgi:polysaccharide transporter, PST family
MSHNLLNKNVFKNFCSLSVLQAFNYILPLLVLPYLIRTVGLNYFGVLMFSQSIINYFIIIVDYGFNLSATREVSIHRNEKNKLIEIYTSVTGIKLILFAICSLFLSLLFLFDEIRNYYYIYVSFYLMVLGQIFFPIWFFQGIEKMEFITLINVITKTLCMLLVFVLILDSNDFWIYPVLVSLGFILSGIYSIFILKIKFGIKFEKRRLNILSYLKKGYPIFISTFYTSFFRLLPLNLLGFMYRPELVAIYALAEKIIRSLLMLQQPIVQSLFPRVSVLFKESKSQAINQIKKFIYFSVPLLLLVILLLNIFSHDLVILIGGVEMLESVFLFKLFTPLILIIFLANIFGSQIMLNIGLTYEFQRVLKKSALLSIFVLPVTIYYLNCIGAVFGVLLIEFLILAGFFSRIIKDRILIE